MLHNFQKYFEVHFDLSCGKGAGQPLHVFQFERKKDEMDTRSQIDRTLWIQKVVGGSVTNILFITHSYGFIHSVERFSGNALVKKNKKTCTYWLLKIKIHF